MRVFFSVSRATMTGLKLRTWPLLLPLLPLWDLSNLSWGSRGCQVAKSHRQELSVSWWWFLGMCVHMHTCACVETRDSICVLASPLLSTLSLETGSLTDWTRLVPVSSRGTVVSASPVQLQAATRLASSEGAGESNSCWCSQHFTDPTPGPWRCFLSH